MRPGYQLAEDLLEQIEYPAHMEQNLSSWLERLKRQQQAKHDRVRHKITRPDPSLREVVPLYSREVLSSVALVVMGERHSGMKKAELVERILSDLGRPANLERVVEELTDQECAALQAVLAHGGAMPWHEFDAHYGNDRDELPYWNYHTPETVMGRLRQRLLLAEATLEGIPYVCVPVDLRQELTRSLI